MRKPYSWHKEFYEKSINAMAASVEKIEGDTEGWLAWFEKEHPQLFEKYSQALKDVYSYWGSINPGDMEQFKGAVKAERDATLWAVVKYVEHQVHAAEASMLVGRQESMNKWM